MQPTKTQVTKTLEALRATAGAPPTGAAATPLIPAVELPDGVIEQILGSPSLRSERLDEARRRLEAGDHPSDDDLAERMVGRLVCDRLR
ncbi:MAG: hypothetical protein JJU45_14310 [Acidimicrobiia bacterium]|nr:hypothetical protein [Acidimicrobiia bacterium]